MQDSGCGLPRRPQVVEKVVVGPIGSLEQPQNTSKPAQNTTKPGFKALERGSETSTRGFFNTLGCFAKFASCRFSEVGREKPETLKMFTRTFIRS
jgi:hypothetical protein